MNKKKGLILFLISVVVVAFSCQTKQKLSASKQDLSNASQDTVRIKNDSLSYEITIIEPGFEAWLGTQRPRGYYEQAFLEVRNIHYVNTYNARVLDRSNTSERELYPVLIDYQASIDYGYEVNYLLFHYFLYFEERYNQKL